MGCTIITTIWVLNRVSLLFRQHVRDNRYDLYYCRKGKTSAWKMYYFIILLKEKRNFSSVKWSKQSGLLHVKISIYTTTTLVSGLWWRHTNISKWPYKQTTEWYFDLCDSLKWILLVAVRLFSFYIFPASLKHKGIIMMRALLPMRSICST